MLNSIASRIEPFNTRIFFRFFITPLRITLSLMRPLKRFSTDRAFLSLKTLRACISELFVKRILAAGSCNVQWLLTHSD